MVYNLYFQLSAVAVANGNGTRTII